MDVLRPFFDWLIDHTYIVVFLGTVIDATGLPFPGRLLLVAAGAFAASGGNVLVVIALAAVGAMLVDQVWYLALTRGSTRLIDLYCRMSGHAWGCDEGDSDYVRRYGGATIILGRFFTSVRLVAWPLAAAHGIGYGRFVILDAVGAALWASTWVLLGWFVGEHWEWAARTVGGWAGLAGAVVVLALAAPLILRFWRRRSGGRRRSGKRRRSRARAASG